MKSIIIAFIILCMCSCIMPKNKRFSKDKWECSYYNPLVSLLDNTIEKRSEIWKKALTLDTLMIDYLLAEIDSNMIGEKICISEDSLKVNYPWNSSMTSSYENNQNKINRELYFIYLIHAIYYKDLYFCSGIFLYSNSEYEEYNMEKMKGSKSFFLIFQDYKKNKASAISAIKKWRTSIMGKTIEQVRLKGIRPLEESDLFWIGEKGGKIDSEYSSILNGDNAVDIHSGTNNW